MNAPPMSAAFVRRRMAAELGADWRAKFADFELAPAAAASLGQVHRATSLDGRALAVKLQYPDMQSAVESDLAQMRAVMALGRQMFGQVDTREIAVEISERIREELDYGREAKAMALYRAFFAGRDDIAAPEPVGELSTGRLLTMTWLRGPRPHRLRGRRPGNPQPHRAAAVRGLVDAADPHRRHPRRPAPWQLHVRGRGGAAEPAGLRLHPHLPAQLRRPAC